VCRELDAFQAVVEGGRERECVCEGVRVCVNENVLRTRCILGCCSRTDRGGERERESESECVRERERARMCQKLDAY